jgi:hypothetical protein
MSSKKDKHKLSIQEPPINQWSKSFPHLSLQFKADQSTPYFSFKYLDKKYCISNCTKDEKAAFVDKMKRLTERTWAELKLLPRHGLGREIIKRSAIRRPIPGDVTEDTSIIAFRFQDKKPMVGFQLNATFYIIWFDRDFTLYDHGS